MAVIGDFLLLNILFYLLVYCMPISIIPPYFHGHLRILFIAINISLVFSEFFYSSIIHLRRVTIDMIIIRVFRLSFVQVLVMYFILKFVSFNAPIFRFTAIWGIATFVSLETLRFIERWGIKYLRSIGRNIHYVTLIGDDPAICMIYKNLIDDASTGYKVLGYYANKNIENCPEELKHIGSINDLNDKMEENERINGTDDVFCCLSHDMNDEITKIMKFCDRNIIHFFYVPRMVGNFSLNLKIEKLGDMTIFTNYEEPLQILTNRFIKRTFDIVFSLFIIICMLPIFPIIAIIIKIQSPGPVFFKQERTGINGNSFKLYKFRSMHVNKEADILQATKDDPRKYPFGNFMRKTNIDELPQFINVLIGNMSVVGPRPHMLKHTEMYSNLIDKYMVRHFAKPGITGWAQVTGWRGETNEVWQMEERVKCDIWYIENWNFVLDIRIIYRTLRNIITHNDSKAY